jgi:HEAT repeat protein
MRIASALVSCLVLCAACAHDVPGLLAAMDSADERTRQDAAFEIASDGEHALPTLLDALGDRGTRRNASVALGLMGSWVARPVAERLDRPEAPMRVGAAFALGVVAQGPGFDDADIESVARRLVDALGDEDPSVREAADETLRIMAPLAFPWIVGGLAAEDPGIAAATAAILGDMGPGAAQAAPYLTPLVGWPSRLLRLRAITALGKIGSFTPEMIGPLAAALESGGPHVRAAAADDLSAMGAAAAGSLGALLAKPSADVQARVLAARALGRMGPAGKAALNELVAALGDPSPDVRWASAVALSSVYPVVKEAATILLGGVGADAPAARKVEALSALSRFADEKERIAPVVTRLLGDPDGDVREAAAGAKRALEGGTDGTAPR